MAKLKLTDELCGKICNDIKAGVPLIYAAGAHGISKSTFYNWYNDGKKAKSGKKRKFYEEVEEAKSIAVALRVRRVYKAGDENWQADAWWLERVCPDIFGRKDHHTVEANVNHDIKKIFNKKRLKERYDARRNSG